MTVSIISILIYIYSYLSSMILVKYFLEIAILTVDAYHVYTVCFSQTFADVAYSSCLLFYSGTQQYQIVRDILLTNNSPQHDSSATI